MCGHGARFLLLEESPDLWVLLLVVGERHDPADLGPLLHVHFRGGHPAESLDVELVRRVVLLVGLQHLRPACLAGLGKLVQHLRGAVAAVILDVVDDAGDGPRLHVGNHLADESGNHDDLPDLFRVRHGLAERGTSVVVVADHAHQVRIKGYRFTGAGQGLCRVAAVKHRFHDRVARSFDDALETVEACHVLRGLHAAGMVGDLARRVFPRELQVREHPLAIGNAERRPIVAFEKQPLAVR